MNTNKTKVVNCMISLLVHDEPIEVTTSKGKSMVKAELLGLTTIIRPEETDPKRRFRSSIPLVDSETGEKIASLQVSGKNIFAPRERRLIDDGVVATPAKEGSF